MKTILFAALIVFASSFSCSKHKPCPGVVTTNTKAEKVAVAKNATEKISVEKAG